MRKAVTDGDLDQFDLKILDALAEDGRISVTDLAAKVGLSKTPCQIRMRRLIDDGYIDGFKAVLNRSRSGSITSPSPRSN